MRLVIDVNIVHSTEGMECPHPTSVQCRTILTTIFENNHKIVISSDLRHECVRHATKFSTIWYYQMKRNNLIEDIKNVRDESLRERILVCFPSEEVKKRVRKDIHLIEAALVTDKKIISNDLKERKKFKRISSSIIELEAIIWVSPNKNYEQIVEWLKRGASSDLALRDWFLTI
jgi:hypothetical protein